VVAAEQDVGRLDVAVQEPAIMGVVECLTHLVDDAECARRVEGAARGDGGVQVVARDEPHGHPQEVAVLTPVEDIDDVRVLVEPAQCVGLPCEALTHLRVRPGERVQHLQCDVPVQPGVAGAVDRTHATCTELLLEDVPANGRANSRLHHRQLRAAVPV
jgi:hypothetical protein